MFGDLNDLLGVCAWSEFAESGVDAVDYACVSETSCTWTDLVRLDSSEPSVLDDSSSW